MHLTIHPPSGSAIPPDEEADAVAAALLALQSRSSCCAAHPASSAAPPEHPGARASRGRGQHRSRPVSRRFVLPEVTVVEPTVRREVADVLVADGRIADLLPPGSGPYQGYDRLDAYRGSFVTAGLIDMHGHLPPDNVLSLIERFLLLYLAHGITTVRDAGDPDGTALPASRDGLASGRLIGPRFYAAGPFITKGRPRWSNSLFVAGPEDAPRIARRLVDLGARCMKIYENLSVDEIAALERAAAEHGLVTLGHVPTPLGIEEAPLRDAQHFFGVPPPSSLPRDHVLDRTCHWDAVDEQRMEVVVRSAVEGGRANTPTLVVAERLLAAGPEGRLDEPSTRLLPRFFRDVVWHPRRGIPAYRNPSASRTERLRAALEKKLQLVNKLYRAGAALRVGTDIQPFVVPGISLHQEMRLFERAGVPVEVILRMATRDAAIALGRDDLGAPRRGATADLLVCSADPTRDLAALSSIRAVVREGALFASEHLRAELDEDLARRDRGFARVSSAVLSRLAMGRAARNFTN
jgi:hypothetical protein